MMRLPVCIVLPGLLYYILCLFHPILQGDIECVVQMDQIPYFVEHSPGSRRIASLRPGLAAHFHS